jgi:hypothetical protein
MIRCPYVLQRHMRKYEARKHGPIPMRCPTGVIVRKSGGTVVSLIDMHKPKRDSGSGISQRVVDESESRVSFFESSNTERHLLGLGCERSGW